MGLAKPDPAIFEQAMAGLGVPAANVLYVADGMSGELAASIGVGMRAVRCVWSNESGHAPAGVASIRSVAELAPLIGADVAADLAAEPV